MKYRDPIYDRTIIDVRNRTSKGYMNFSDWRRIRDNSEVIASLEELILSLGLAFISTDEVNINVIPTADDINAVFANVKTIRDALAPVTGTVELQTNWGGTNTPKHTDINDIEKNIDLLLQKIIEGYSGWVVTSGSVRYPRTGSAECGTGLTRQSGFRRYA